MRTVYIADDGTEFDSEKECRAYERRLDNLLYELQNGIHAYDEQGNFLDLGNWDLEELEYAFELISYIKFDNQKAIDVFVEKAKDFGLPCFEHGIKRPLVVGERYYYNWHEDGWCCVENDLKNLEKIMKVFN